MNPAASDPSAAAAGAETQGDDKAVAFALELLDRRLRELEDAEHRGVLKKITANAGAIALFLGLVLTLASLHDVFFSKPKADRVARIGQFNQAVNSAAKIRQDVMQIQLQTKDPVLQMTMLSAATPRILNDVATARAILATMDDSEVGIPQLIILITESFTAGDLTSAQDFVTRANGKTDASPYLRSEAKRYEAKLLYATGKPDEGRAAYQSAVTLIGESPLAAAPRAYTISDWIAVEFQMGDCAIATATLKQHAADLRSPVISLDARRQLSAGLTAQLEQIRGSHCEIPMEITRLIEG